MCVLLFAPGRTLQIDYAAESITLQSGGRLDLIDLLLTNHSREEIERIHIIYPHPVRPRPARSGSASFADITPTLLDDGSPYNEFYSTEYTTRKVQRGTEKDNLIITMIQPSDVSKTVDYSGYIKGTHNLIPYEVDDPDRIAQHEWQILSDLGWSVFTLKFTLPLEQNEARWLRLRAESGILPLNHMSRLERTIKRYLGILVDRFEIAGPLDVRHRLLTVLRAAGMKNAVSEADEVYHLLLHNLYSKLVTRGVECNGTQTIIKDWRLNIFPSSYRRCDEPSSWGDILPCGPIKNTVKINSGMPVECYQWKAGDDNVPIKVLNGMFGVRIQAHDEPLLVPFLPWISVVLAAVSLVLAILALTHC